MDTVVAATRKPWARELAGGPFPGVELTLAHLAKAYEVARQDYERFGKRNGTRGVTTDPDKRLALMVTGRQAEFAVAAYFGLAAPTADTGLFADVGKKTQVRGVTEASRRLYNIPKDRTDEPFVSVLCWPPFFYLRGWLPGFMCQRPEYWCEPHPPRPGCWLVPTENLSPIDSLEAIHL